MTTRSPNDRFVKSEQWLDRAEASIPLGSQTFSKSRVSLPRGVSPLFIERGKGSQVWDADGNSYIDFINGLLSVSLGYCDPDVDSAVQAQMQNGVSFSLPHRLEMEVAEAIIELVPCAEKVRFGKNGSDATGGAIRVARAFTGREHVAVCGYHGWQDWYIGSTTRDLGVPANTKALTHKFEFNKLASLEELFQRYPDQLAAVILEPMNLTYPQVGFLEGVQALCQKNGTVLVFDETITGFRFSLGGAQELFGVTPDLATFGKGVGNGYPISFVTGRADIMKLMEEVFFSFTFGGETLSLAATQAVIRKLRREPVIEQIRDRGQQLIEGLQSGIKRHQAEDFLEVMGHPSWSFLVIRDTPHYDAYALKTLYLQEMFARGILINGTHNLSYAHQADDIERLLSAYDEVIPMLRDAVVQQDLLDRLRCEPLKPLFKVR